MSLQGELEWIQQAEKRLGSEQPEEETTQELQRQHREHSVSVMLCVKYLLLINSFHEAGVVGRQRVQNFTKWVFFFILKLLNHLQRQHREHSVSVMQ